MSLPRILPLVGIAVGGVLGLKVLAGLDSAPDLLKGAQAFAEEAAAPKPVAPKAAAPAKAAPKAAEARPVEVAAAARVPAAPLPDAGAAKPPAPQACTLTPAELARAANLSPAELQVLQSLGARRGQLDQREKDMDVQLKLLTAAEAKLDAKLKAINAVKAEIQGLLGDVDQKQEAEVQRLVSVYEKMRPREAAAVMATLDDKVRVPVASKMKDRSLAAVMAAMPPAEAKRLTELLAKRYADASAMANTIANPPPAAPEPVVEDAPAAKPPARRARPAPAKAAAAKPRAGAAAEAG